MKRRLTAGVSDGKETLFIALIGVYIMGYATILLEPMRELNYVVKFLVVALIFMAFGHARLSSRSAAVVSLYAVLLVYSGLLAPFTQDPVGSTLQILKYGLRVVAFAAILMILQTGRFSERVLRFPMWAGVVLATQSLILLLLVVIGRAPDIGYLEHPTRGVYLSFGVWGFGQGYVGDFLRLQSFFSESSQFAAFLEYGLFVSAGLFRLTARPVYLLAFALIASAFAFTFSLAGYLAALLASAFLVKGVKRYAFIAIVLAMILVFDSYLTAKAKDVDLSSRNAAQHLILMRFDMGHDELAYGGRAFSAVEAAGLFMEHPFGLGLMDNRAIDELEKYGGDHYIHLSSAFFSWLVKTGLVGMGIFLGIFLVMWREIRGVVREKRGVHYYVALGFIAMAVHGLSSGDWIDPMFLLVTACLLSRAKIREAGG